LLEGGKVFLIFEGQWINDKLDGFGRGLKISFEYKYDYHIGFWKNGERHGYVQSYDWEDNITDALYEGKNVTPITDEDELISFEEFLNRLIYAKWVDPSPIMNKPLPLYETESGDEKLLTP
jgi:hypothetical protein